MGKLFDLEAEGYFYSRLQNPTNDYVAAKITALEGGTSGMLTSSGQAANFFAVFNICEAGSHIVSSSSIYGGTYNLLAVTMKKMGVDVTFVDRCWKGVIYDERYTMCVRCFCKFLDIKNGKCRIGDRFTENSSGIFFESCV